MKFLRYVGVAVLASLVGLGGVAQAPGCTVTLQPGQSIQEALNGANKGAVICLAAGEWKESLSIEKSLTLRAAEVQPQPTVVIRSAKEDWPVILIRSEEPIEVVLQGLKVTGAFGWCYKEEPEWICPDGISVHGRAKAVIQNTTISDNEYDGISMWGSAQASIEHTTISDNNWHGIEMEGSAQATIEHTTISGNEEDGIFMGDSAQASILNTTISGNLHGIRMWGSAQATIQNNTIQNNRLCGIRSSSQKPAQGEGNRMKGNGVDLCGNLSKALRLPLVPETSQKELPFPGPYASLQETIDALAPGGTITIAAGEHQGGLTIWKPLTLKGAGREQTTLTGVISLIDEAQGVMIQGVEITGSPGEGILLGGQAQASIQDTTISDNIWGIEMWGSAQASIQDTTISGNKYNGIEMWGSAQASIQNTTISGNKYNGIEMWGSAQASILNNTIQNNGLCGIISYSNELARGEGNLMKGNGVDLCGNLSKALRLPLVPETSQKELPFPGPYASLQETIDALAPGGTITIAAGEHQGGLTIWKPLTLKGAGREQTTLKGAISLIDEAQGVMIQGVKITGSLLVAGILLGGRAQATIEHTTISGNGWGIWMGDSAQATIQTTTISDNGLGIWMWDSAQATIGDTTISGNGDGIWMEDSARATIEHTTISGNWDGILMKDSAQATIQTTTISDNRDDGIFMRDSAQATIQTTTISDNEVDGILMEDSAQATIQTTTISDNEVDGILMEDSAQATIQNTTISGNGDDGIEMKYYAQATIQNNKIVNNEGYGVACYQRPCFDTDRKFEGAVRGSKNEISGNKEADVCPTELEFLKTSAAGCYGQKC